ncbi:hypothetical protein [Bryocella elongata]|nr:hypothetical protein [Bryocella elongata]
MPASHFLGFGVGEQKQWQLLGNYDLRNSQDSAGFPAFQADKLLELKMLAGEAFVEIWQTLKEFLKVTGAQNSPAMLYTQILNDQGKGYTDCLATLKIGQCVCFSTNFRKPIASDLQRYARTQLEKANPKTQIVQVPNDMTASGQLPVWQRHAEMRLYTCWRLAHANVMEAELLLDKFCCIFCSIQLKALGWSKGILVQKDQKFKALSWYNFAPIAMFFGNVRKQIWGAAVEAKFSVLRPRDKRQMLFYLTQLASADSLARQTQADAKSSGTWAMLPSQPSSSSSSWQNNNNSNNNTSSSSSSSTSFGGGFGSNSSSSSLSGGGFRSSSSSSSSSTMPNPFRRPGNGAGMGMGGGGAAQGGGGMKRSFDQISAPNCEKCKVPRVMRNGPYGVFWSCPSCWSTWNAK